MGDGDRGALERLSAGRWPRVGPGRRPGGGGVLVEMQAAGSRRLGALEESAPCSQEGARLGEGRQFRA